MAPDRIASFSVSVNLGLKLSPQLLHVDALIGLSAPQELHALLRGPLADKFVPALSASRCGKTCLAEAIVA